MVVLPLVLALAVLLGLVGGGRLSELSSMEVKGEFLLVALLVCQTVIPLVQMEGLVARLAYALWFGTYPVMVLICAANYRQPGMIAVALGLVMNAAVIGLNAGMPVSPSALSLAAGGDAVAIPSSDYVHLPMTADTRLALLADVLPIPGPAGIRSVASPGDVLLLCGIAATVTRNMYRRKAGRHSRLPGASAGSVSE